MSSYRDCVAVTPACPVEATTYGYYPNAAANSLFLSLFSVLLIGQLVIGYLKRIYSYSVVIAIGCLLELLGYAGRLIMHDNPWSSTGLRLQIICLIIAPSFIAAGIYLTLKHVVRHNGSEYSRLRPSFFPWIFIGCDAVSICLQAIGGGLAAAGSTNMDMMVAGNNIIIAGIAFQVVTMVGCGLLAAEYMYQRSRHADLRRKDGQYDERHDIVKTNVFHGAVVFAYITILIRCIYRIPEMAGGWGNPRMRNEKEFLILDGLMVVLAVIALTACHPGYFYPGMMTSSGKSKTGA